VLLVDGLAADAELVRDLLPRPSEAARIPHLERLQLLDELAERGHRAEPDPRVLISGGSRELGGLTHAVNVH